MTKNTTFTTKFSTLSLAFALLCVQSSYGMEGKRPLPDDIITAQPTPTKKANTTEGDSTRTQRKHSREDDDINPTLSKKARLEDDKSHELSEDDREYLENIIENPKTPLQAMLAREALRLGKPGFSLGELYDMGVRPEIKITFCKDVREQLGYDLDTHDIDHIVLDFSDMLIVSQDGLNKWSYITKDFEALGDTLADDQIYTTDYYQNVIFNIRGNKLAEKISSNKNSSITKLIINYKDFRAENSNYTVDYL